MVRLPLLEALCKRQRQHTDCANGTPEGQPRKLAIGQSISLLDMSVLIRSAAGRTSNQNLLGQTFSLNSITPHDGGKARDSTSRRGLQGIFRRPLTSLHPIIARKGAKRRTNFTLVIRWYADSTKC